MEKHDPHANPPAYTDIMHASTPNAPPMMASDQNYGVSGISGQSYAVPSGQPYRQPPQYDGGMITDYTAAAPVHAYAPPNMVSQQPIGMGPPAANYGTMYKPMPMPQQYQPQPPPIEPIPSSTTYVTVIQPPDISFVGGCSACRIGVLEDNYPCCGICCAIVFFPVGILCCLCMKNKRCSHCGVEF